MSGAETYGGSKHLISVHYQQTNHINPQQGAVRILSKAGEWGGGGGMHMLMMTNLFFLTATWSGATATASWGVESWQHPPPRKEPKAALSSRFGCLLGHLR